MKRSGVFLVLLLMVSGFSPGLPVTFAQPYPNRPIQLIIPNVPGAIVDINARALAEELGKILGAQIVPLNKPGAGTMLGMDIVAKSKRDGYTLSYTGNSGIVYARILNPETLPYDPEKDLEPLGLHVIVPMAIAVQASSPWKSFQDVVDYAKKNPGKIRVNTIGVGSTNHFYLEVVQSLTGTQFTHIPFKGGESVVTALLGGHVEMTCDAANKFTAHVESGKLRVLLLSNRMAEFPGAPTMSDLGFKEQLPSVWFAMYGPSGLPEEVKKVLVPAIEKAVKQPDLKARIEKLQFVVQYRSPAEMKKDIAEEYDRGLAIAKRVGLLKKN
jgi:tripartite-type tricarboxylate transporter receptor subunit TctC